MTNPQKELTYLSMFDADLIISQEKIEQALLSQENAYKRADSYINDLINRENGWIRSVSAQLNTYAQNLQKIQGELKKCSEGLEKNKAAMAAQEKQNKSLESQMVNALKACQAEKEREEANARKQQNSHGNPHPKNSTNSGSKK